MEVSFKNSIADLQQSSLLTPSALLLIGVLAAVIALFRWRAGTFSRGMLFRVLAALLLIGALADPATKSVETSREIVALLDVSKSVLPSAQEALLTQLEPFFRGGEELTLRVVPFAKDVSTAPVLLRSAAELQRFVATGDAIGNSVNRGETNLARALESASGAPVLLLSDGFETSGNSRSITRAVAASGSRVFPLVPSELAFFSSQLALTALQAPLVVQAGDMADGFVSVRNSANEELAGEIDIFLDNEKVFSRVVSLPAGEERALPIRLPSQDGGLKRLRAVLTPESKGSASSEQVRWISFEEKSKILLLSGAESDAKVLANVYSLLGFSLESIVAEGGKPIPTTFEKFSAVVLNNVPSTDLPKGFLEALRKYVAQGGGLLLVGGEKSFGLGRYIGTPLEEISPVKFVPPQTTKKVLNSAVVLLVDKSRSMNSEGKIDGAQRAALASIRTLKDDDFVAVIGFDSAPFVVVPIAPAAEVRDAAERRLLNLTAAGSTQLLPALATARQQLAKVQAGRKHVIVLTDGKVPDEGSLYEQEISSMRAEGITLSAVGVGAEADVPFLQSISRVGRGAFYQTLDATTLPEIFLHDIKVTTGEKTLKEKGEVPVRLGPDGLISSVGSNFEKLRGFVQTLPKRDARLELIVTDDEGSHPLLASWNYERGTVVAFTSDANGRWSYPWLSRWKGFARFWGGLIETIERDAGSESAKVDFDLRYSVNRKSLLFDLALFDERLRSEAPPPIVADVVTPRGKRLRTVFSGATKGRFSALLEDAEPGDYKLSITYGSTKLPEVGITVSGELFGETMGRGVDLANLSAIASATGGVVNPSPSQVVARQSQQERYRHLAFPLIVIALILLFIEVFVRELGWKRILGLSRFRVASLLPFPRFLSGRSVLK